MCIRGKLIALEEPLFLGPDGVSLRRQIADHRFVRHFLRLWVEVVCHRFVVPESPPSSGEISVSFGVASPPSLTPVNRASARQALAEAEALYDIYSRVL